MKRASPQFSPGVYYGRRIATKPGEKSGLVHEIFASEYAFADDIEAPVASWEESSKRP